MSARRTWRKLDDQGDPIVYLHAPRTWRKLDDLGAPITLGSGKKKHAHS